MFFRIVGHFLDKQLWLQILLFDLLELQSYTNIEQSWVLFRILVDYNIDKGNLRWFILDNIINNNIAST